MADVLAHLRDGLGDLGAVPVLDRDLVRDAEPEHHPPARELVDRRRCLRHRGGRAREDRHHAGAQTRPLAGRGVGHQQGQRVAPGDVSRVDGVEPEAVRATHPLEAAVQRTSCGDEGADPGHRVGLYRRWAARSANPPGSRAVEMNRTLVTFDVYKTFKVISIGQQRPGWVPLLPIWCVERHHPAPKGRNSG